MSLLKAEVDNKVNGGVFSGNKAFELYDTYGFPVDLTEDVLKSYGWTVDHKGFNLAMDEQKNKARKAWTGSGDKSTSSNILKLLSNFPTTKFLGYEKHNINTSSRSAVIMPKRRTIRRIT